MTETLNSRIYCINPNCQQRQNPDELDYCQACGTPLLINNRYRLIKPLRDLEKLANTELFEVEDWDSSPENWGTRKVIKILQYNHPDWIRLFKREARILMWLRHPGIPKVEPDGYFSLAPKSSFMSLHCLVMEHIPGQNLQQWLAENGRISEASAIEWLHQLIEIIDKVHQNGLFHRDIKPSNIMLRPNGQLVLIDFGTVKEVTPTQPDTLEPQEMTRVISEGYSAPEQIAGSATPQSDFFALGRTLVHLLTGRHPTEFEPSPENQLIYWRDHAPQISQDLANFIDSLMTPLLEHRPENAQTILTDLEDQQFSSGAEFPVNPTTHPATEPETPEMPSSKDVFYAPLEESNRQDSHEQSINNEPDDVFPHPQGNVSVLSPVNRQTQRGILSLNQEEEQQSIYDRVDKLLFTYTTTYHDWEQSCASRSRISQPPWINPFRQLKFSQFNREILLFLLGVISFPFSLQLYHLANDYLIDDHDRDNVSIVQKEPKVKEPESISQFKEIDKPDTQIDSDVVVDFHDHENNNKNNTINIPLDSDNQSTHKEQKTNASNLINTINTLDNYIQQYNPHLITKNTSISSSSVELKPAMPTFYNSAKEEKIASKKPKISDKYTHVHKPQTTQNTLGSSLKILDRHSKRSREEKAGNVQTDEINTAIGSTTLKRDTNREGNVETGLTVASAGEVQLTESGVTIPTNGEVAIVSGTLDASNVGAQGVVPSPQIGGKVNILGDKVGLFDADINASGIEGGGTVRVVGDFQGQGIVPNADSTFISSDSIIAADAISLGDGGTIIVYADAEGGDIILNAGNLTTATTVRTLSLPQNNAWHSSLCPNEPGDCYSITTGAINTLSFLVEDGSNVELNANADIQLTTIDTQGIGENAFTVYNSSVNGTEQAITTENTLPEQTIIPTQKIPTNYNQGDIQVSFINAQGCNNGKGSNVDITAGQFRSTNDTFTDTNGEDASISSAGGDGNGEIPIRHSDNSETVIGNATINGTVDMIADGDITISPTQSFLFTHIDDIEIISVDTLTISDEELVDESVGLLGVSLFCTP